MPAARYRRRYRMPVHPSAGRDRVRGGKTRRRRRPLPFGSPQSRRDRPVRREIPADAEAGRRFRALPPGIRRYRRCGRCGRCGTRAPARRPRCERQDAHAGGLPAARRSRAGHRSRYDAGRARRRRHRASSPGRLPGPGAGPRNRRRHSVRDRNAGTLPHGGPRPERGFQPLRRTCRHRAACRDGP